MNSARKIRDYNVYPLIREVSPEYGQIESFIQREEIFIVDLLEQIEEKENELAVNEQIIDSLREALVKKEDEIRQLYSQKAKDNSRVLARMENQLRQKDEMIELMNKSIIEKSNVINSVEFELKSVRNYFYNSNSWKLTRLFRFIKSKIIREDYPDWAK